MKSTKPSGREDLTPGCQVELVCLGSGSDFDRIRSRTLEDGEKVIVRTGLSKVRPVPGEIFTMTVERSWTFGHTRYAKGLITDSRLEVSRLGLEPLALNDLGLWTPREHDWLFENEEYDSIYEAIRGTEPRPQYKMEQILPEDAVELRWEEDPILEAIAFADSGYVADACEVLEGLLAADLRCIDAHAHLGHFEFRASRSWSLDRARRHYRAGLEISGLGLAEDFVGVLPWLAINNRPYLRCLHGYGLCLWREGDLEGARRIFERLVWLNPFDNVGARLLLPDVEKGVSWENREAP